MGIYKILSHIYLDKIHKCYKKILIFNNKPEDISNIKTVPQEKNHHMMIYIVVIDLLIVYMECYIQIQINL